MKPFLRIALLVSLIPASLWGRNLLQTDTPSQPWRQVHLVFENIRPLNPEHSGHLHVLLSLKPEGATAAAFADYNEKSKNYAKVLNLKEEDGRLEGTLKVSIGPDGARRGRKHFPTPNDEFEVKFRLELDLEAWAEARENREAFMPYWRKDTPPVAGRKVGGVYDGSWSWKKKVEDVEGTVTGAWRWRNLSGGWQATGSAAIEIPDAKTGHVLLQGFLPETQRVDGITAWAQKQIDPAMPISHAVLKVSLAPLAPEVSVDVLPVSVNVKTERGWFHARDRITLGKTDPVTVELPLKSLGTRWRPFVGTELQSVQIGVANGTGIGRVSLKITGLELLERPEGNVSPEMSRIVLHPSVIRSFNGVDTVPAGLFGFHDVGHNKVNTPKNHDNDPMDFLEEIQPGLLRPLTHTGFNGGHGTSDFFRDKAAKLGASELVVWTHTMDLWARPPWMDGNFEGFLSNVEAFYGNVAKNSWSPDHPERVLRYFEVWNEPFMWGRHINMGFRLPRGVRDVTDDTQFGYIPGKVGAEKWSQIFMAAVKGAKEVNPHIQLGGPSAPGLSSHNYADYRNYTERIIQEVGEELDFFTEHHYGGNPLVIAAEYEVVRSAFHTLHGRKVPVINTEANDLGASDAGKALYNLTEILHLINTQPDVAKGRALHALWSGHLRSSGERDAWRLMAPLRGKILDLSHRSDRLTVTASLPEEGRVVLLGADHGVGDQQIGISMPRGFRISSLTLLLTELPKEELQIRDVDGAGIPDIPKGKTRLVDVFPKMENGEITFGLPSRSAFRLILEQEGFAPHRRRHQQSVMLDAYFTAVEKGEDYSLEVPDSGRPDPDRLFLRTVMTGAFQLKAGETVIDIPAQAHRMDQAELRTIEVPPKVLTQNPKLMAMDHNAVILSASWVWE